MSLVNKKEVKKFLGYDKDTHDGLIDDTIVQVEDFIENDKFNGTAFDEASSYESKTEKYDGDGTSKLLLDRVPARVITSIYMNSDTPRVYNDSDDLVSSDNIILDIKMGIVILDGLTFTKGVQNIAITYTAGWTVTDAPDRLKQAIIRYVVADVLEAIGGINLVEGQDFFYKPKKLRDQADKYIEQLVVYR